MRGDELARLVEVGRRLHRDRLDALEAPLGQARQHTAGGELEQAGDATLGEAGHDQVPAHRGRDLARDVAQHLGAGPVAVGAAGVGGPVEVGQEGQGRVGGVPAEGHRLELGAGRVHERGVEGAGHLQGDHAGTRRRELGQPGQVLQRAGGDRLAGTVDVGGPQAGGLDGGQHLGRVTAHHGAHARRRCRRGRGHRPGTVGDQAGRAVVGQCARYRSRGELAHGVTCGDVHDVRRGAPVQQRAQSQQGGGDDQRLSDCRVPDRVGVRDGAVRHQVQLRGLGCCGEALFGTGQLEPVAEHPGGLRALSRADDGEHASTLPSRAAPRTSRPVPTW